MCCVGCLPEVDKGIHAPGEGDHILHRPKLLKGVAQQAAGQALVQVAQPQVARGGALGELSRVVGRALGISTVALLIGQAIPEKTGEKGLGRRTAAQQHTRRRAHSAHTSQEALVLQALS